MKRILAFAITLIALISLAACNNTAKTPEQLIVGNWVATGPVETNEEGMTITFSNLTSTYKKDHTALYAGDMSMAGAMLPKPLEMHITGTSTWAIEGSTITEKNITADVSVENKNPNMPDVGAMISQQMIAEAASTSTIITLDKKTLVMKEDASGMQVTMKRK